MLYDYRCAAGHISELRRSIGTTEADCPECGLVAKKLGVYRTVQQPPAVDVEGLHRRFKENAGEMLHERDQYVNDGQPAPSTTDLWSAARREAGAMLRRGEMDVAQVRRLTEYTGIGRRR